MADTRTTIRIDSVGADKVKRDFADITAANDKAASGFQKTGGSASNASAGIDKMARSTRDYASHANVASTASDALGVGLASLARYASAGALLEMGRRTVMAADSFKVLQNQLRVAGFQADELTSATDRLFQISNKTQTSIEANATLYGRLSAVQGELGASSEQLFKFTEAVGNALKINNTEAGAAQGALLQLSQAMGGAKIQAQEFNSLIDGMRPLLAAAAQHIDGAGGSVSKLRQMVIDGELSNKAFFDGILKGSKELEEQAAKSQTSISQSLVVLRNKFIEAAGESEELTAVSNMTAGAIKALSENMDEAARLAAEAVAPFALLANAIGGMGSATNDFLAQYPALRDAIKDLTSNGGFLNLMIPGQLSDLFKPQKAPPPQSGMGGAAAAAYVANLRYGGTVPVPIDKPDSGRVEQTKKEIEAAAKAAEKAAKQAEEWQGRIADGWRDLYEKVGENSSDFYTNLAEDIQKAGEAEDAAQKKQRAAIEATIEDIQFETSMIGLSNDAREKAIALRQQEAAGASPDQMARTGVAIDAQQAKQAAQDAADEVKAVWDQARGDFSDSWSDLFYGIFNDGKFRFKDLADSFKSIWARTLADLLTMSIQNSFIKPMFQGLFGGGTGAAGTTGIFGSLGASLFGGGSSGKAGSAAWMEENVYGPSGNGSGGIGGFFSKPMGASTIGGILGGAGIGMGLGAMTGSGMAGAAGGAIGMAVGGPIGAAIGGLLGGLIGGLFKSTPKSISSYGTGGIADSMASGGLDVKIGKDMASGVVRALKAFAEQLVTGIESDEFLGIVGQRGKKFFYQAQETDLKVAGKKKYGAVKFDTAEEAIAAAIEAAINSGVVQGLTDADKKLMRAAGSVEQAMQDVVSSHNFKRELDFQYIGLSSPLKEAQARLEFEYQQQLILAEKYEADKTKLEAVYAQKRLDLVEQYNSQQYAGLKSFLTSITAGSASPLSPTTRLGLAQANYSALSAKARSGDQDAIAALQGAAQDYLSAGKDVFASGGGYQSIYQQVVADLSKITGVANPLGVGAAANSNVAASVNDNTRAQAGWFTQAAAQRSRQIQQLDTLNANVSALVVALSRGTATPTQSGTVQVGTIDWASVTQAVASLR